MFYQKTLLSVSLFLVFSINASISIDDPFNRTSLVTVEPNLENQRYIVGYDSERRIPKYVVETITKEDVTGPYSKRYSWKADNRIEPDHRCKSQDYKGAFVKHDLHKGHLAPAGNYKSSSEERRDTFLFSNCAPQYRIFNTGIWKLLEEKARKMTEEAHRIHIVSGPLFLPEQDCQGDWWIKYRVIGQDPESRPVAVPTHFFKIVVAEQENCHQISAWILPNVPNSKSVCLEEFEVSMSKISSLSGLVINLEQDSCKS